MADVVACRDRAFDDPMADTLQATWRRDMFTSARRWRISGIAGLLFVVISFVASAINVQPPQCNQDSAEIGAWFAKNSQQYRVGHFGRRPPDPVK